MVKNKTGGNRHKKLASKNCKPQSINRKVRLAVDKDEIYAKVVKTVKVDSLFYVMIMLNEFSFLLENSKVEIKEIIQ